MSAKEPPFKFLRVISITTWIAAHYALASFIMFNAAPSPTVNEIERLSHGVVNRDVWGIVFAIAALALTFDRVPTPNKLRIYMLAWLVYAAAAAVLSIKTIIVGESIPGIHIAALAYISSVIFMTLSCSVLSSTWEIAGRIAEQETKWLNWRLLTRTDIKGIDDDK